MSGWSHLANAKHIDLIIAHVKANPAAWESAVYVARDAAYAAAWNAAVEAARFRFVNIRGVRAAVVRHAVCALVAWDYAGGLMDSPAEQVKVLAILGDQAALLMYPAIAAMETTQELV